MERGKRGGQDGLGGVAAEAGTGAGVEQMRHDRQGRIPGRAAGFQEGRRRLGFPLGILDGAIVPGEVGRRGQRDHAVGIEQFIDHRSDQVASVVALEHQRRTVPVEQTLEMVGDPGCRKVEGHRQLEPEPGGEVHDEVPDDPAIFGRIHRPHRARLSPCDPVEASPVFAQAPAPLRADPVVELATGDRGLPFPPEGRGAERPLGPVRQTGDGLVQHGVIFHRRRGRPRGPERGQPPAQPARPAKHAGTGQPERRDQPAERLSRLPVKRLKDLNHGRDHLIFFVPGSPTQPAGSGSAPVAP